MHGERIPIWACGVVVSHPFSIREAPGSIPGESTLLDFFTQQKYIEDFIFIKDGQKNSIRIFLKYSHNGKSVITGIDRVSKPGRRVFVGCKDMPRVLDGLGVSIISTSKGVLSNRTASKFGIGGEVLFNIW